MRNEETDWTLMHNRNKIVCFLRFLLPTKNSTYKHILPSFITGHQYYCIIKNKKRNSFCIRIVFFIWWRTYHTFVNKSRRKPCISSISKEIAYHQHEVLYIIIAKAIQPTVDDILALSRYARQSG